MAVDCFNQPIRVGSILFQPRNSIWLVMGIGSGPNTAFGSQIGLYSGTYERIREKHLYDMGHRILNSTHYRNSYRGNFNYSTIPYTKEYMCLPDKALINKPKVYSALKKLREDIEMPEPESNLRIIL